jgi:hypothetical protein
MSAQYFMDRGRSWLGFATHRVPGDAPMGIHRAKYPPMASTLASLRRGLPARIPPPDLLLTCAGGLWNSTALGWKENDLGPSDEPGRYQTALIGADRPDSPALALRGPRLEACGSGRWTGLIGSTD